MHTINVNDFQYVQLTLSSTLTAVMTAVLMRIALICLILMDLWMVLPETAPILVAVKVVYGYSLILLRCRYR